MLIMILLYIMTKIKFSLLSDDVMTYEKLKPHLVISNKLPIDVSILSSK